MQTSAWPFRRVFRVVSDSGAASCAERRGQRSRIRRLLSLQVTPPWCCSEQAAAADAQLPAALRVRTQVWWVLCTATFCALPLTIWEFKNQGFSPHYQGAACSAASRKLLRQHAGARAPRSSTS